jgi:hypothetical protein
MQRGRERPREILLVRVSRLGCAARFDHARCFLAGEIGEHLIQHGIGLGLQLAGADAEGLCVLCHCPVFRVEVVLPR